MVKLEREIETRLSHEREEMEEESERIDPVWRGICIGDELSFSFRNEIRRESKQMMMKRRKK